MRKKMKRKSFLLVSMIMVLSTTGCIKETYDMSMLSKKMHLSPTLVISAIKGDISLSDIVKSSDKVVFDQNKFVTIVFRNDSVVNLKLPDFSKGTLTQMTAHIEPDTLNFDIAKILSHITGDFQILNPLMKFNYSNSFKDSIKLNLNISGKRVDRTVDLNLAPFLLAIPDALGQQDTSDSYLIDKTNSSLSEIISLPPEKIYFSGTAVMNSYAKNSQKGNYVLDSNHLLGSIEIEVPLELRINNLQFTDTLNNFLADAFGKGSGLSWEDFEIFRIDFDVKNGFPMGISLEMSLLDSLSHQVISTIGATDLIEPAPIDSDGKAIGVTISSTSITFTSEFFSSIKMADKIIYQFTLNTTDNDTKDVKIYSDYRLDFKAALVMKPDYKFNLK
jgi:hypothetical protein